MVNYEFCFCIFKERKIFCNFFNKNKENYLYKKNAKNAFFYRRYCLLNLFQFNDAINDKL